MDIAAKELGSCHHDGGSHGGACLLGRAVGPDRVLAHRAEPVSVAAVADSRLWRAGTRPTSRWLWLLRRDLAIRAIPGSSRLDLGAQRGTDQRGRWRTAAPSKSRASLSCRARASSLRAFTVIELVLCIAIVALLLALLTPIVSNIRWSARNTSSLVLMRQHVGAFVAYSTDYKDTWPAITSPVASWTVVRGGGLVLPIRYFDATTMWPVPLAEPLYGSTWRSAEFHHRTSTAFATPFWYSGSFLADPAFWSPLTRTGPAQWRPTRSPEVLFPSAKALIARVGFPFDDPRDESWAWFAMVDGSAAQHPKAGLPRGYLTGAGEYPGAGWLTSEQPGMTTIDGVRGRDVP